MTVAQDGRKQHDGRKFNPGLLFFSLWRSPNATKVKHFREEKKERKICINPYHYEIVSDEPTTKKIKTTKTGKKENFEEPTLETKSEQDENNNKERDQLIEKLQADLAEANMRIESLEKINKGLTEDVKKMRKELLDLKGNIRVICRIRPSLKSESQLPLLNFTLQEEFLNIQTSQEEGKISENFFYFDRVFGPESSQDEVFSELSPLLQKLFDGQNICIFAYGQSGSGKTFTMGGKTDGMIPQAINSIFKTIDDQKESGHCKQYIVKCSFLELTKDGPKDLLNHTSTNKPIIKDNGEVANLEVREVQCAKNMQELFQNAQKHRSECATSRNKQSSRSHAVTKIQIESVGGINMKGSTAFFS